MNRSALRDGLRHPVATARRLAHGGIAHDTFWSLAAQGGRAVASLGTFIILTRALGVRDYGLLAGVLALAKAIIPFSTVGARHLIVQRVSRDHDELASAWGDALITSALGVSTALVLVAGIGSLIIPNVPLPIVLALAAADFIYASIAEVAASAYVGLQRFRTSALLINSYGLARLATLAVAAIVLPSLDLRVTGVLLLGVSVVHAIGAAALLAVRARPELRFRRAVRSMRTGANYMVMLFSDGTQSDIDKTMLVSANLPAAAGVYTAGYRIVSYALLPVSSLIHASYPRFFVQGGSGGVEQTWHYARRLARPMAAYGACAVVVLWLLAQPVVVVIGEGYGETATVIRLMAPLLLVQGIRTTLGNTLTGADLQTYRTVILLGAAVANIGMNLLLIPQLSWRGALLATYLTEALIVAATLIVVFAKRRQARSVMGAAHLERAGRR